MLTFADTVKYLTLVSLMPEGVIARMKNIPEMVETSNNLGVVRDLGDDGIFLDYHGRSSSESKMYELEITAKQLSKALGIDLDINGRYSGWPMKDKSPLADLYIKTAPEVFEKGITPRIAAIHAGLECGIICSAIKDLDAISIGPVLKDIHAPGEALELSSFSRLWSLVVLMLERMK